MELHSKELVPNNNNDNETDVQRTSYKKRHIYPKERQQTIDELRLALKKDAYF